MDTMRDEVLRNAELRGRDDPAARPAGFSFSHGIMTDDEARRLVEAGLIETLPNPGHKRAVLLRATRRMTYRDTEDQVRHYAPAR